MIIDIATSTTGRGYLFCSACGTDVGFNRKYHLVSCGYDHDIHVPMVEIVCMNCRRLGEKKVVRLAKDDKTPGQDH